MIKKTKHQPFVNPAVVGAIHESPSPEEFLLIKDQLAILDDKFKRVLADYQNQQKRHEVQKSLLAKFANESLLDKILPILDDLERAQGHLDDAGLGHVIKLFHQIISGEGLSLIDSDGADFDPETMDCAEVVAGPKDKVVRTVSKGYLYYDKVLRPAKVEVGSGPVGAQRDAPSSVGAIHESPSNTDVNTQGN